MPTGKLYWSGEEQFLTNVEYQVFDKLPPTCYGELIPTEYSHVREGRDYTVELDDCSKIKCNLKKKDSRALSGNLVHSVYDFEGTTVK